MGANNECFHINYSVIPTSSESCTFFSDRHKVGSGKSLLTDDSFYLNQYCLSRKEFCDIRLRVILQEVLINLIYDMFSEITFSNYNQLAQDNYQ